MPGRKIGHRWSDWAKNRSCAVTQIREVVHPGVHLDEFLQECGFGYQTLSDALAIPLERVEAIMAGNLAIDADTAVRLATAFAEHPSAEFWMKLQARYELAKARERGANGNVAVLHRADSVVDPASA